MKSDELVKESLDYARTHQQAVRIVWMDREPEIVSAMDAVWLCSDYGTVGRISAVVAQDKKLQAVLNKLMDDKQQRGGNSHTS